MLTFILKILNNKQVKEIRFFKSNNKEEWESFYTETKISPIITFSKTLTEFKNNSLIKAIPIDTHGVPHPEKIIPLIFKEKGTKRLLTNSE